MLRCSCGRMREVIDIHKKCAGDSKLVPAHMGWNWNTAQVQTKTCFISEEDHTARWSQATNKFFRDDNVSSLIITI